MPDSGPGLTVVHKGRFKVLDHHVGSSGAALEGLGFLQPARGVHTLLEGEGEGGEGCTSWEDRLSCEGDRSLL